jgi:predicted aspartyl protease
LQGLLLLAVTGGLIFAYVFYFGGVTRNGESQNEGVSQSEPVQIARDVPKESSLQQEKPSEANLSIEATQSESASGDGPAVSQDLSEPPRAGTLQESSLEGFDRQTKKAALTETAPSERELTATEWYERGISLDDESDAEINSYLKALELDPKFAAAYYRLGAIYFRRAEYDPADEAFSQFLEFATEEDRQAHDIYVYYSPAEVETLFQVGEKGETLAETEERRPVDRLNDSEIKGLEATQELKTVVTFSSQRGYISVPVLLNEQLQAHLLLDTGAGITLISKALARRLGLRSSSHHSVRLKTVAKDIRVPLARLEDIRFGHINKQDFPVAISDLNLGADQFDGILGMDFLRGYDIHIDHKHHRITLIPRS